MFRSIIGFGAVVALPLFVCPVIAGAADMPASVAQIDAPDITTNVERNSDIIVQPRDLGEIVKIARTKDIFLLVGSWETLTRERKALEDVGNKNKRQLSVMYVDPTQMPDVEELLKRLMLGPRQYPTHLYIGRLILPFAGGELREEAIAKIVEQGLVGPQTKRK